MKTRYLVTATKGPYVAWRGWQDAASADEAIQTAKDCYMFPGTVYDNIRAETEDEHEAGDSDD